MSDERTHGHLVGFRPEEIAQQIVESPTWDNTDGLHGTPILYETLATEIAAALRAYGAACAAQERARCAEVALSLGWRADATDGMRVAATSIAAAIRATSEEER